MNDQAANYCTLLLALMMLAAGARADAPPGVMSEGIYCRESSDRIWHVRLAGEVVSLAGVYMLVHDVDGRVIFQKKIPAGVYSDAEPYTVPVEPDGMTGDYLITILGSQRDYRAIRGPFTDLPHEVYGHRAFMAVPYGTQMPTDVTGAGNLFFKVTEANPTLTISGGGSPWEVHDVGGAKVFDVRTDGREVVNERNGRKSWVGTFRGQPGRTYVLRRWMMYFDLTPRGYLAVSPDRWFEPDARLQELKWWRHTQ